jgi:hypothetical protein
VERDNTAAHPIPVIRRKCSRFTLISDRWKPLRGCAHEDADDWNATSRIHHKNLLDSNQQ